MEEKKVIVDLKQLNQKHDYGTLFDSLKRMNSELQEMHQAAFSAATVVSRSLSDFKSGIGQTKLVFQPYFDLGKQLGEAIRAANEATVQAMRRMTEDWPDPSSFFKNLASPLDGYKIPLLSDIVIKDLLIAEPQTIVEPVIVEEDFDLQNTIVVPSLPSPSVTRKETEPMVYDLLPEDAERLGMEMAFINIGRSALFFRIEKCWIKEYVQPQAIDLIRYMRKVGDRTGYPGVTLTELAQKLVPNSTIQVGRSRVSNLIADIRCLWKKYGAEDLFIKVAREWQMNPCYTRKRKR